MAVRAIHNNKIQLPPIKPWLINAEREKSRLTLKEQNGNNRP
jgi:hypothetical protein